MQQVRRSTYLATELLHHFLDLFSFFCQLRCYHVRPLNQLRETHLKHSQGLASTVVYFAGDASSFFILYLHQPHGLVGDPDLLRRFFLGMNIETASNVPLKRSIRRIARYCPVENPTVLPSVMPHPVLHLKWTPSIEAADIDLQAAVEVLWMYILSPAIARLLF